MNEKIDFVIIWVDGNDKEWQKEKERYSPDKNTDSRNIRYRDWENLKYWFRGVEKFAPWVNKIYFVTWGHVPEWLDLNNKKLVIVNHKDFIPKKYLPTFNVNPIEMNFHRIKGLSEQFVYFNDDTFLTKMTKATDFFKNGMPVDVAIESGVNAQDPKMYKIYYNDLAIINSTFNKKDVVKNIKNWYSYKYGIQLFRGLLARPWKKFIGFYNAHNPQPLLKETYKEIWNKYEEVLDNTSSHKFRSEEDVNQYLLKQWQLCKNNFYPRSYNFSKAFSIIDSTKEACEYIEKQKTTLLCVNDSFKMDSKNFNKFKKEINDSFEKLLPEKCSYEK